MRLEERTIDMVTVVQVHGDIVLNGSHPSLADRIRHLLDENHRRIVLDLADVRYVDSGGLGEIVESFTAARNRGGTVKLLGITRRLNDLLVITKLLHVFECFETEAEAVQSFGAPAAVR
ncbi:MAG TPA: STAS domain-containing protein [Vicinamibacterales bacterium]|nr:STAS domain-containing protein [Vicinamibacterales bacterium]